MNLDLSKIKTVFFIGIGGIGISALAKMAISRGMEVLGINDEEGKTVDSLRELGVKVMSKGTFDILPKENLQADMYVYSDAWIYRGPEILEQARRTGKPALSYFEALGIFAKEYKVIAVAGTHGKTTTTAMISELLVDAGLDPTCVVGSFVKKFGSNFRKGKGPYLVVEADEYNRHFLNFNPFITVITNIEADHLDYYKDLADIQNAFRQLITQTENAVVYNAKDTSSHVLVHGNKDKAKEKFVDYMKYLEKATAAGGAPQNAVVPKLSVPGEHNRLDAAAALAVAEILGIPDMLARKSIAEFSGTWRRLEKKGVTKEGAIIYDDYAHHPTEIKASLQALRELYTDTDKTITVLFQPHLYSRTKALFKEFAECFDQANNVFLLPIYFAREDPDPSVSSEKLAEAVRLHRGEAVAFKDFGEAEEWIKRMKLGSNDVFVTMGAGEAYKVSEKVFRLV